MLLRKQFIDSLLRKARQKLSDTKKRAKLIVEKRAKQFNDLFFLEKKHSISNLIQNLPSIQCYLNAPKKNRNLAKVILPDIKANSSMT
jgi:arginine utilization protein RocB